MRSVQNVRENMVDIATAEMRKRFMRRYKYTLDEILCEVAYIFNVDVERVKTQNRKGDLSQVRSIFCYVASQITNYSLCDISIVVGGHEHTKAWHHINKVKNSLKVRDPHFLVEWDFYTERSRIWQSYKAA